MDVDRLNPSQYNLNTAAGSASLQKVFADYYPDAFQNSDRTSAERFVNLIMHSLDHFHIAAMEIRELRDNSPSWTKTNNSPMKHLFDRTKLYRPLPLQVTEKHTEHDLIKTAYAHRMLSVLYPFQADARVDDDTKVLCNLAGSIIAELFEGTGNLKQNKDFMSGARKYAGNPFAAMTANRNRAPSNQSLSRPSSGVTSPRGPTQTQMPHRSVNVPSSSQLHYATSDFEQPNMANTPIVRGMLPRSASTSNTTGQGGGIVGHNRTASGSNFGGQLPRSTSTGNVSGGTTQRGPGAST